ncbi:MAG: hypothetical protein ABL871_00060 [Terricaulis sp.]
MEQQTADITLTSGEYGVRRDRLWLSFAVGVIVALLFLFVSVVLTGVWAGVCLAAGIALTIASIQALRMIFDKRPLLRISAEGIYYRPFAADTVPWSEITAIAHWSAYTRSVWLGRVSWTRAPSNDQINFAVADPSRYPNHIGRSITRAMQRAGGLPPIIIQLWSIDVTAETIKADIRKYWPGEIARLDPRVMSAPQ